MPKDPVCGMEVQDENTVYEHEGKKYYFCSKGCLEKFKKSPEAALGKCTYDLIIIGGGPSGLTAGVYASVLKLKTYLITKRT